MVIYFFLFGNIEIYKSVQKLELADRGEFHQLYFEFPLTYEKFNV